MNEARELVKQDLDNLKEEEKPLKSGEWWELIRTRSNFDSSLHVKDSSNTRTWWKLSKSRVRGSTVTVILVWSHGLMIVPQRLQRFRLSRSPTCHCAATLPRPFSLRESCFLSCGNNCSLPRRRSQGFVTRSCPKNVCWHKRSNSFPIIPKYQLERTCRLLENQSADKPNTTQELGGVWYVAKEFCCGQGCRRQRVGFLYISLCKRWIRCLLPIKVLFRWGNGGMLRCSWTKGRMFLFYFIYILLIYFIIAIFSVWASLITSGDNLSLCGPCKGTNRQQQGTENILLHAFLLSSKVSFCCPRKKENNFNSMLWLLYLSIQKCI